MARRHQTAATVPSRPGEHGDGAWGEALPREPGEVAPGVLHHAGQVDAELFDHDAVHLAHLIGGDRGHAGDLFHHSSSGSGRVTSGRFRLMRI